MKFSSLLVLIAVFLVGALSCGADEELIPLYTPEATSGDYGVAVLERTFRIRVDDTVHAQLYFPTDNTGAIVDGELPVVLFIEGGAVQTDQYAWLAAHIASQGYLVAAPSHFQNLAIFSIGNGADLLNAMDKASSREGDQLFQRVSSEPALAMGHSLGGVIATKTWLAQRERFSHLVLLQSRPDPADSDDLAEASFAPGEVFAIAGSEDLRITPETVAEELGLFSAPVPLAVVEGQNHFQLVDGSTPGQAALDGPARVDDAQGRARLLAMIDLLLENKANPGALDVTDPVNWPDGVLTFEEYQEGR